MTAPLFMTVEGRPHHPMVRSGPRKRQQPFVGSMRLPQFYYQPPQGTKNDASGYGAAQRRDLFVSDAKDRAYFARHLHASELLCIVYQFDYSAILFLQPFDESQH